MEFFDRKQEVIDIQLTPYGRQLVSMGKWKPKFYAFYDKDITYDTFYAGYEENQKDSADRIKGAVRPKAQAINYGIESQFSKMAKEYNAPANQGLWMPPADISSPSMKIVSPDLNDMSLIEPLGTSRLNSSFYPAFSVEFLVGNISTAFNTYTGSNKQEESIPQLNTSVTFRTEVKTDGEVLESNYIPAKDGSFSNIAEPYLDEPPEEDRRFSKEVYADGSYITIKSDQVLFDIIEKHIPLSKEDFDLEVFIVTTETKNLGKSSYERETFKKLNFIRDDLGDQFINYGDQLYNRATNQSIPIDNTYVEYWFDLRVDKEIEMPLDVPTNIISQPANPEEPCADE